MSLASTTNRNDYTANGSVDTYAYTFKIFDEDDLTVIVKNTSDVETVLTKTTHYTVTGVGSAAGGNVALVNGAFDWIDAEGDLKVNYTITIRRVLDLIQDTDIRNQGAFYPEIHEDSFDKFIMIDQQQQDEIDRSIKLSESIDPADFSTELPASIVGQANVAIITNATGDGFEEGPTADEISNAQGYATAAAASATDASEHKTTAERWAKKTDGSVVDADTLVDSGDYSAKAWAIGGTGVTDTASRGAAKEWAIETSSTVDGTDYSAKEWAKGTQTRGAANGGSAKDWATYTGGTVDNAEYSAKYWAEQANQYLTANNTWTGNQTFQGEIYYNSVTDNATTGSGASFAAAELIHVLTNVSLASINNISSPTAGQVLILLNQTGANVTVTNDSGGTAANRIKTGTGSDLTFKNNAALFLVYDSVASRWQVVGGAGGSDATYATSTSLTGGGTISVTTGILDQTILVASSGGLVTLSSTPFSGSPTDLTVVTLIGNSDANPVAISYNDASNGCVGNFETITLHAYQTARFRYVSGLSRWVYVG